MVEGEPIMLMGDHVGKKLMRVVTLVTRHSAAALLVGSIMGAAETPALQLLKVCINQSAHKMSMVQKLMDKLSDEKAIDAANAEGGTSTATTRR